MGWQLEGDKGSMENIRAYSYTNGHEPVVRERLVALERAGVTKGAERGLEKTRGTDIQSSLW